MIDLNRIRSVKTLETMKKPLIDFVAFDKQIMLDVYSKDYEWGIEDYESDIEAAEYLLERLEKRIKSLKRANLPNDGREF